MRANQFLLRLSLILTVGATSLSNAAAQQADQPAKPADPLAKIPKVVAVVNGKTISREQLADDCLARFGTVVLDNLLNKRLILQACEAKNIVITQQDVNDEIERTAGKFGLTTPLFLKAMQEERDVTPEQYASEITWPMLALRALAAEQIKVSEEEIEKIIQSEYGAKVQVRMLAVTDRQQAEQLRQQAVEQPETFRRLAKQYSEDAASASVDGLLPPIRRFGGDDDLEKFAFQLKPDEISPIFQVGNLHVVLQCVRHLPAQPVSPQLLPMIRQRIADEVRDARLGDAANQIFAELQKSSEVVVVLGNQQYEKQYPNVAGFINRQPVPRDYLAAECIERHGKQILRGEINRVLLTMALEQEGKVVGQPDINAEVARAAEDMGFIKPDGSADIQGWLASIQEEEGSSVQLYIRDAVWPSVALKKLVEDKIQITPQDLQEGFQTYYGPKAEVLAIVLTNQRTAEDVFRKARNATEKMFGELAAEYSVEPMSRSNFGKVPALRRGGGQPTLEQAAFSLQPGEVSGVIALNDQYAILYKQGETESLVKDLEPVREELTNLIRQKKLRVAMQDKLDDLLSSSKIENLLDNSFQIPTKPVAQRQAIAPVPNAR